MDNNNNNKGSQTPPEPRQWPAWLRLHGPAVYLALIYLLVGLAWIFGTDYLLSFLPRSYRTLEVTKGALFVLVTAWLLYSILQRNTRLKLAAVAQHYDYLTKYANDIFLLADEHYRIVEANERAVEAYGYSHEELIGMPIRQLRAEEYRDRMEEDFRKLAASGTLYEIVQRRRDGTTFPVEVSARLIEVAGHRYFQAIIRDISERRRAEATIAQSRQRFLALLDSIPDPAWMKDTAGAIIAVNKIYARICGKAPSEMIGKTEEDFWPPDIAAGFRANDKTVISTRVSLRKDEFVPIAAGGLWSEVVVTPMFDDAGAVIGTNGIARDITDRKQFENRLRFMNTLLVTQQEVSPDGILLVDEKSKILNFNRHFAELFGIPQALIDAGDDEPVLNWCLERMREPAQELARVQYLYAHREERARDELHMLDGHVIERHTAPVADADDTYYGRVWFFRDITGERKAQMALAESENRFRKLVELSPDAVTVVGADGNIVSVNPAGLRMFGLESSEQAVGKDMYRFVPEEHLSIFQANLAELMRRGSLHEVESLYRRYDGSRFFAEVSSSLTPGFQPGQPPQMTAIIRDITERKRREAELIAVNRALHVLSECNGNLVRATEEDELLDEICKTLTTTGGYRMALVGYEEAGVLVKQQAVTGVGGSPCAYDWDRITRTDQPNAAAWRVIDSGNTVRIHEHDTVGDSGRHASPFDRGVQAILVLPLKDGERTFGVMTLYAENSDAFSEEEVRLLEELAGDLAFGIRGIRIRKARDEAMQSLNASEAKLRTIIESASDGMVMIDLADVILFANPSAERLLKRPIAALVGSGLDIPLTGDAPIDLVIRDGSTATVELDVAETEWDGRPARIVTLHDITVRRQIEIERQRHLQQMQATLIQTIEAMAATVEKRDPYTAGHQARVAELAVAIGRGMGLPEQQLEGIKLGAMIHDIGKIYIPAEILNRPGRLGEHEMGLIRTHPQVGFDIVKNIDFIWPVKEMIVQHHERVDGSGYPAGLKGDQITLEARIIGVADVVEAMASHRPYRPSLGVERGLEEIRNGSGSHYDAMVVKACLRLFEEKRFDFDFDVHG